MFDGFAHGRVMRGLVGHRKRRTGGRGSSGKPRRPFLHRPLIEVLEDRRLLSLAAEVGASDTQNLWGYTEAYLSSLADWLSRLQDNTLDNSEEQGQYSLPIDPDLYAPLPIPDSSNGTGGGAAGSLVSYDVATGQEYIQEGSAFAALLPSNRAAAAAGPGIDSNPEGDFPSLTLVPNPEDDLWRRTVKLFMTFPDGGYVASGALIDPFHVITAGHCVNHGDGGDWATSITVVPGYESGAEPYGSASSVQLHSWTGWTEDGNFDHDIGIIDLDRPIGALTGWLGYGYSNSASFFTSSTFNGPGYPAESPYDGQYLYTTSGSYDYTESIGGYWFGNEVGYYSPAYGGQSGSGFYLDSTSVVYAVMSNSDRQTVANCVRLTSSKFEDIRDSFITEDTPSTYDLIPLGVEISPSSAHAGVPLSSMSYLVHNYSSAAFSGTVNVDVYLSTNDTITTGDRLIQSHSFDWSFEPLSSVTIDVSSPPTIPADVTGDYWIGIILDISDYDAGNNVTNGFDTAPVHVVNFAPDINSLPDRALNEDTSLNKSIDLWAYASDYEDSDSELSFSISANTNPNCGVSIDADRYIDISPTPNWWGYSDVTIRVQDRAGLYDTDTFRVTVNSLNDPPTISGLPDRTLDEDTTLNNSINLWGYAADVETGVSLLTYTIVGNTNPDCGASIDSNHYVDIAPAENWYGQSDVTIRVQDPEGASDTDTFHITVNPLNDYPAFGDLPDQTLNEDTSLNNAIDLWAYAADPETPDSGLTYTILGNTNPNCGATIDSNRYIDINPTANWYGQSDVTVWVWDPEGELNLDTFRITVLSVNDPPVVAAVADSPDPVMSPGSVTLTATGVSDAADPTGSVIAVRFYRESNGQAGLQTGAGGDAYLGSDNSSAGGWTVVLSTAGLPARTYSYYAQAFDNDGLPSADGADAPVTENTLAATVEDQWIFYNASAFDGNDPAPNALDDLAIAPDKAALLPTEPATLANYTSYSRGINGIMVDINGLGSTSINSTDFTFQVGNDNNPGGWDEVAVPPTIHVRSGDGANGSDRVTIIFAENLIRNQWLQVTVLAGANSGLVADHVFYFGNAVGETGDTDAHARVDANDVLQTRNHPHPFFNPASITCPYDFNRDERVDANDLLIVRNNQTTVFNDLNLITVPAAKGAGSPAVFANVRRTSARAALSPAAMDWLYQFDPATPASSSARRQDPPTALVDRALANLWC